jgi:hypothetical protein
LKPTWTVTAFIEHVAYAQCFRANRRHLRKPFDDVTIYLGLFNKRLR